MAINERLVHTASASAAGTGNQEEGLMLHLDANDVDSYDGDGDVWYDIHDHEYTPATNVSEHFNTVLYTGTSLTNAITGVGFSPDLVWLKQRNSAQNHGLFDTVRGTNNFIMSNSTSAENARTTDTLSSFDADGFTLTPYSSDAFINYTGRTMVAWCFKAGGLKNKAAGFNGSSSNIDISGNPLGVNDFTYSVWFNAGTVSVANQNIITSNAGHVNYGIQVTGTGVSMYALNSSGGAEYLVSNTGLVSAGTWYHIAYVKSSISGHSLYLNGNVVASDSAFTGNCASGTGNETTIGSANNNIQWFNGKISQVRLFNSALTSSQITQLYNETPEENNGHLLGCVAAFPLNDNANEIDNNYTATASNVTFGLPGYANRNNEGTTESTVSANNDLGFSVVKYNGLNTAVTAGHGLESPPEMVICKPLAAGAWAVWHKDMASDLDKNYIPLTTGATTPNASSLWNYSNWGATKIGSSNPLMFGTNNDIIAYCFTSKRGVSKVGSYRGTGASMDVYTGFEPAFVIIKNASASASWHIFDNERTQSNPSTGALFPDDSLAEADYNNVFEFTSTGFRNLVTSTSLNTNGSTYIYYAVAKDTNETELADTVGFKPSIDPEDHFNTVTYTGDASTRSITGVGFQPDLVWIKERDDTANHHIFDVLRGGNKKISSNTTSAEGSALDFTLDSDGFSINNAAYGDLNGLNDTYVAWCFKAGGAASLNEQGDIDSQVSVNNDLGFSIAKYTATGVTATVGHGLDTPPEMIIAKTTNQAYNWIVYHKDIGASNYLMLNTTNALASSSAFMNNTSPTSSVFTAGAGQNLNYANNDQIVAYNFTSKRGVSKVGSFEGTGASGNKIYTEFEPAFVMWKNADNSASNSMWFMFDNQRGESAYLMANSNSIEGTDASVQFHRDGFIVPNAGAINNSGQTHIYYAVAKNTNNEQPHLELNLEADSYSGSGDWLDSSGNGNNGTITGATHNDELGDFFDLDGSGDYIDIPTSGVFTGDFTVEMWWNFNTLSPPSGSAYRMLLGASGYSGGSGLGHYIENNRLRTWVSVNGSTSNVLNGSGTDLTTNKWQHVVLTRSGGTYTQYIDTNQVGQASGTTASLDGANSRIGGHYNVASSHDINAKVGQVRLYDTALSQAQIRQNYNFTKPSYPNGFDAALTNMSSSDFDPSDGHFTFSADNDRMQTSFQPNVTVPFTASVWVKRNSGNSGYKIVIDYTQNASPYNGFGIFHDGTGDYGMAINGGTDVTIGSETSGFDHLVFVYNGGTSCKTYINGVGTTRTLNNAIAQPNTSTNFVVGNSYVSTWSSSRMDVSDVKFYDRALTDDEVTAQHGIGYNGIG